MKTGSMCPYFIASIAFSIIVCQTIGTSTRERATSARPEDSSTTAAVGNVAMKEWFSALLGLSEVTGNAETGGKRRKSGVARTQTPQYVQNLYDRMVLEDDDEEGVNVRRRRSLNNGFNNGGSASGGAEEPVTIQAVTRNPGLQNRIGNGNGNLLQFDLRQQWIPNRQLRLAELILAVDFSRLIGPPSAYSVHAYLIDPAAGALVSRDRLSVITGSLTPLDTFRENFVKLNVTDSVFQKFANGNSTSIVFEIFVAYNNPQDGGGSSFVRDLGQDEVKSLLHLSSHGAHQPILVLYSASPEAFRAETGPATRSRRQTARSGAALTTDEACRLNEWWVDLAKLFQDRVVAPEGFYASFCGGSCPAPLLHSRWNASANAHLRSAFNMRWRLEQTRNGTNLPCKVPEPKCVAQSYSPMTVLFNADSSFIIRRLDKVIVNSCMCA